jgi:hypothetical protein
MMSSMTTVRLGIERAMSHHEIPVQVTAWVDEGVADLVTALNAVGGVMTLDSCQEEPDGLARVTFCTHDDRALPAVLDRVADCIDRRGWGERAAVRLWTGCDGDALTADLYCPPSLVAALAGEIRVSAARRNRSDDDTARTTLRSWTASRCHPQTSQCGDGTQHRDG